MFSSVVLPVPFFAISPMRWALADGERKVLEKHPFSERLGEPLGLQITCHSPVVCPYKVNDPASKRPSGGVRIGRLDVLRMQGRLGGGVLSLPSVEVLKRRPDGILSGNIRGMTSHKVSIGMEIGKESLLYSECSRWDYVDRYRFAVADPRRPDRAVRSGRKRRRAGPSLGRGAVALRNRIVSVFGFKTPAARGKNAAGHGGEWESGERVGIFEVLARSTDEIVLGDNDPGTSI